MSKQRRDCSLKNIEHVLTNAENTANKKTAPLKLKSSESAGDILVKNVMVELENDRNLE
jgi:hypothetical protein